PTGTRAENLAHTLQAFEESLAIYTLEDLPLEQRDTQVDLATFALAHLVPDARARGDRDDERSAYLRAHHAFLGARRAQAELGWLESDPQGRARSRGWTDSVRGVYARGAWCLVALGDLAGAAVALEAGRAHALTEAQQLGGAELD